MVGSMRYIAAFERVIIIADIDSKVVANTPIWTNGSSTDFVISGSCIRCTEATSISSGPTIGLGTAAGTNNILSPVFLELLTSAGKSFNFSMIGMSISIPPGGSLYSNITLGAVGTSQLIDTDLKGYWL